MTRVLHEPSRALPVVNLVVAFGTGAFFDPHGQEGLSRFTGRMLRRGTRGRSARELEAALDRLGGELSVEVSATTTTLHAQVIRRNLGGFVDLLAEVLGSPAFAPDEVERLRKKVLAELIEARDSDRHLAQVAFRAAMFEGHPFGRSAQGRPRTLATITPETLEAHYRGHYLRETATFGFAGDVGAQEASEIAERLSAALPSGAAPSFDARHDPPGPRGRRLVIVDKPERSQTQILIGALGTSGHDPDHVPLLVGTAIFGGTFTSRLMREVRSKRGWSYGASARLSVERVRHALTVWTFPASTDAPKCVALELDLLERFVERGVTPRETAFVRNYLVRSHAFEIDTPTKRLHQALDTHTLALPADYHTSYLERVRATTAASASAAVRERISTQDLAIVVVGTASTIEAELRAALPRLDDVRVVPFDADADANG